MQSALLLYRPLIWVGQDGQADPDRSLAQSVTADAAGTRFLVTLKPWRWSDGLPVTADDVVFAWSLIAALGPAYAYAGQGGVPDRVQSVTALDAAHVEFRLRAPTNPQWFELAALSVMPALPRHAWGSIGPDALWQRQTDPALFQVVDGPFKLERFEPDRFVSYLPNPLYGGHQAGVARLVIDFLEGGNALHALRAGDVDMAQVPLALWDSVRTLPGLVPVTLPEPFGYLRLVFNLRNGADPFFRDARVRRALTDAADQQTMIEVVYAGDAVPNRVPIPSASPIFRSPAVQAGQLPVRSDPGLARRELDAAGWHIGADGMRVHDGVRLAFTTLFTSDSPERTALLQVLQQDLRAVGVAMRLQPVGFNQLLATAEAAPEVKGHWDAILMAETLTGVPDGTGYFDTGGASNYGGYSNPRMDALIGQSTSSPGLAALYAYQDLFAAEQPANILPQGSVRLLVAERVRGVADFFNAQGFLSPEYLSVADAGCGAVRPTQEKVGGDVPSPPNPPSFP